MAKTSPERGRGRPAKLSREQIVNCALKMIQRSPGQKITMTGVARALNTAPMSLYTHVHHRDDLMDGIAERVMGQLQLSLDSSADWQTQVRDWLNHCYQHLSRYPQIVELLTQSDHIPPSWLRVHSPLIQTLKNAGLRGAELANASQWVAHQLIGALVLGFARRRNRNAREELDSPLTELDEAQRAIFADITPYLLADADLFPYTVEQVIYALNARLEGKR